MDNRCFKIGNRTFCWANFRWIDKKGNCDNQDLSCINNISTKKCTSNLCSHCCKHVMNGKEIEKTKFIEASSINSLEEISMLNDEVIEEYRDLSERVIKDTKIVGLSATRQKVNLFCVGNNSTAGFVDYLSDDSKNGHTYGYGIVSMYYKDIDIDSYWMLRVIGNCIINKSRVIEGETIKPIFNSKVYDYEPVDSTKASFMRIKLLYNSNDEKIEKSISAYYMFYHDRVEKNIKGDFYNTVNINHDLIVKEEKDFVKINEEKMNYSINLLFIELFYKDKLEFKMAFPSEFDYENNRIIYDKYINHNNENGSSIIIQYYERIKKEIEINNEKWDSLCNDINANINSKEDSSYETKDTYEDTIIARFTAYDIVRKFAYYYMSVLILWKIKDKKLFDYGIDKETINSIEEKLKECPVPIKDCWNIYDSLFCLSDKIKPIMSVE